MDSTPDGPADLIVNLAAPTSYLTRRIRIHVDTFEEIDAMQLNGGTITRV